MGLQQTGIESLPFVTTAELNYLRRRQANPALMLTIRHRASPNRRRCPNRTTFASSSGRLIAKDLSLDREGFALVKHPTVVEGFLQRQGSTRRLLPARRGLPESDPESGSRLIFDHTVHRRVEALPMSEAPVRGNQPRASMSTRPFFQAQTASANICPTKPTSFSRAVCR